MAPSARAQFFSIDRHGGTAQGRACECGLGLGYIISEGDILTPNALGLVVNPIFPCASTLPDCAPAQGPGTPIVRIFDVCQPSVPFCLGFTDYVNCHVDPCGIGETPTFCILEVDAVSFGQTRWGNVSAIIPGMIKFSVDRQSVGVPFAGSVPYACFPAVDTESLSLEAHADVFVDLLGLTGLPPIAPTATPIGNVAAVDGDGCRNAADGYLYPAFGLLELMDFYQMGDDVDALELAEFDVVTPCLVYFSLDSLSGDDSAGTQGGYSGADILARDLTTGITTVFRTAAQLGLSPTGDDIDALAIGIAGSGPCEIPPSENPVGILFSVRRGSLITTSGALDSNFGSRIDPGDVLEPSRDPQTNPNPGIYIAAEVLGLVASRGNPEILPDDLDALALGAQPARTLLDCNQNGIEDAVDLALANDSDCNANGIPDACEINPTTDTNNDGWLDECQSNQAFVPYCFGDGSGTTCPCGNNSAPLLGEGCLNSTGVGAILSAYGSRWSANQACLPASGSGLSALVLTAKQMLPGGTCFFFQGDAKVTGIEGGDGAPFGDGLRCAGTNVIRLQTVVVDAFGMASTTVDIGALGGVQPGDIKYYQAQYRDDDQSSYCGTPFNFTNGLEVTWN